MREGLDGFSDQAITNLKLSLNIVYPVQPKNGAIP